MRVKTYSWVFHNFTCNREKYILKKLILDNRKKVDIRRKKNEQNLNIWPKNQHLGVCLESTPSKKICLFRNNLFNFLLKKYTYTLKMCEKERKKMRFIKMFIKVKR